jgi:hypothetical protein
MGSSERSETLTREGLERRGFRGFRSFAALWASGVDEIPASPGVYAVLVPAGFEARFLASNPGGRFKGRDPSVPIAVLAANWADGAVVVYVGKADDLRRRLQDFCRFGQGRPVGHWGGRLIWQLSDAGDLIVAWRPCSAAEDPFDLERELIHAFQTRHDGRMPFANLASPRGERARGTPRREIPTHRMRRAPIERASGIAQVTLHEEIVRILREHGDGWMTTSDIAQAVNTAGNYRKRDGSAVTPFQIHGRTRKYPRRFERDGSRVRLQR